MKGSIKMADGNEKNESVADVGQNEAEAVNLKMVVANESDIAGRNRILFDAMAVPMATAIGGMCSQMLGMVKQSRVPADKTAENTVGINETDHIVAAILNSPFAEFAKTLSTQIVAASTKQAEE